MGKIVPTRQVLPLVLLLLSTTLSGCRSTTGRPTIDVLAELHRRAAEAYRAGEYVTALSVARKAEAVARAELGAEDPRTLSSLARTAHVHVKLGRLGSAERLYRQELEANRLVFGATDPRTVMSLNNLGTVHLLLGRLDRAEESLEEALRTNSSPDSNRITSLNNLAYLNLVRGRYDEAENLHEMARALDREELLKGSASAPALWVATVVQGDDFGPAVDCTMFGGGNGPFNPDPETGGDMAQCGPFGTRPTFGMWDDWWSDDVGDPAPPFGGDGDGRGGTGFGEGPEEPPPLTEEDTRWLPDGMEEDFNGCSRSDPGQKRTSCCGSVREDCEPMCEDKQLEEAGPDGTVNPFVCEPVCEKAENRCGAGKKVR